MIKYKYANGELTSEIMNKEYKFVEEAYYIKIAKISIHGVSRCPERVLLEWNKIIKKPECQGGTLEIETDFQLDTGKMADRTLL